MKRVEAWAKENQPKHLHKDHSGVYDYLRCCRQYPHRHRSNSQCIGQLLPRWVIFDLQKYSHTWLLDGCFRQIHFSFFIFGERRLGKYSQFQK